MKNLLPALLVTAALALVSSAKADTLLTLSGSDATGGGDVGSLVVGMAFTPDENITVTQLGAFAGGTPVTVTAGDSTTFVSGGVTTQDFTAVLYTFVQTSDITGVGTVIDNAVIDSGTPVNSDDVAFTTLGTPLTLLKGVEYFIGSDGGTPSDLHDDDILQAGDSNDDFGANEGFVDAPTGITLDTSGFSTAAPTSTSVGVGGVQDFTLANVYFAGNLQYTIPEPSGLAYGFIGLAALAVVLRRRPTRSL